MSKEESTPYSFKGDNAKLVDSIKSLLALDSQGALVPHGVGGMARQLLESAVERLAVDAQPAAFETSSYGGRVEKFVVREDVATEIFDKRVAEGAEDVRVRPLYAHAPAVERSQPISCDAANEENAPTFMGEPNPHHSIDWYREGITKHWKTICDQRARLERLIAALKFYADRDHYSTDDGLNWDSVSGEPMNILWHEEQPWFIEDGSVARAALSANAEPSEPTCCTPTAEEKALLASGDYTPEELWGASKPSCPKCHKAEPAKKDSEQ